MKSPQDIEMLRQMNAIKDSIDRQPGRRVNQMLRYAFTDCSHDGQWLSVAFEVDDWMINPIELLHGGMTAAMLDISCGMLSLYYSKKDATPTVSLSIDYLRGVELGDTVDITARAVHLGGSLNRFYAEAFSRRTGKRVAAATATFFAAFSQPNAQ